MDHILLNPDDFLGSPRVWSPDAGKLAWNKTYEALELALKASKGETTLYVVCGIQGSGKTTWIENNTKFFQPNAIILDAALPGARHRVKAISLAKSHNVSAIAIWIKTPIDIALNRNRFRPSDQQVPDETIQSVAEIFESPSKTEGFREVFEIEN